MKPSLNGLGKKVLFIHADSSVLLTVILLQKQREQAVSYTRAGSCLISKDAYGMNGCLPPSEAESHKGNFKPYSSLPLIVCLYRSYAIHLLSTNYQPLSFKFSLSKGGRCDSDPSASWGKNEIFLQLFHFFYSITDKVIPTFSTPRDLRSTSFFIASQSILNLISLKSIDLKAKALKLNFS